MKTRFVPLVCLLWVVVLVMTACAAPSPTAAPTVAPTVAAPTLVATKAPVPTAAPAPTTAAEPTKAAQPSGTPIKIGIVTATSGLNAAFGTDQIRGAQLAVKQINAAGGILGRPVVLIERDDKLQPAEAAKQVEDLIANEKVDLITGSVSAATTVAINEVTKRANVLHFSPAQTNALNTAAARGAYTFHLVTTAYMNVQAFAPWITQNLGKKIFTFVYDFSLGVDYLTSLDLALGKENLKTIGGIKTPIGTTDYSNFIPQIRAAKPEVLLYFLAGSDRAAFLKQALPFGLSKEMKVFSVNTDIPWDSESGFAANEGEYAVTQFYWEVPTPSGKKFVDAFTKEFNQPPGGYAGLMYQDILVYRDAVVKAGSTDAAKVTAALEGMSFDYLNGPSFIRKCDHQLISAYLITKARTEADAQKIQSFPKFAYREVLATIPADEKYERTCKELGFE
jgi:ABC-type branched-subunit amino acid transport system substrate-binding protein